MFGTRTRRYKDKYFEGIQIGDTFKKISQQGYKSGFISQINDKDYIFILNTTNNHFNYFDDVNYGVFKSKIVLTERIKKSKLVD